MLKTPTIKLDRFIAINIVLCMILLLAFIAFYEPVSLNFLCSISLVNTIIVLIAIFKVGKRLFSVSSMFMLFLAVFHFGQAWLYVFGAEVDKTVSYDIFAIYSPNDIYEILLFSLLSYNFIALFWLLFCKDNRTLTEELTERQKDRILFDKKVVLGFGTIFFCILLVPVLIYDYLSITIVAQQGHIGLYDQADSLAVWSAAESYFPFAVILVLLSCNPEKKGWRWVYYYAIGRSLLLMILTGKRGSFVIPMLLYIFCKHSFIKKYKKKHIFLVAAAGILLLSVLSFISYGRGEYSNLDFVDFIFEKNIIVQTLSEFGASFTTTILSYSYAMTQGFLKGKSYLGALSIFLPFSNSLAAELKEYMSVSALLNSLYPSSGALGGSFFAEMYINFGFYALLLTPLFAWLVSKIENVINNANKHSLFAVCSSIYMSYGFWIYVRGNLVDIVIISKRTLYVFIAFLIFKMLFVRRGIKYEEKPVDCI